MPSVLPSRVRHSSVIMASRERLETGRSGTWNPATLTSREILPAGCFIRVDASARLAPILERVVDLSRRQEDCDSYGGRALQPRVVTQLIDVLAQLDDVIQTEPAVSMTGEGGLVLAWENEGYLLELSIDPAPPSRSEITVYFEDASGTEWEGPAADCHALDKWLWQASAAI